MSERGPRFLSYGRQSIGEDDIAAVFEVLRGEWLTTGPAVDAFEADFAARVGARHAVACSSGTAALHLAALALGWGSGDWIAVPAVTFLATANAVRYVGAEVIFADVDPGSGLMTPDSLDRALDAASRAGRMVRAVSPVQLNGQCCDMAAIADIARGRGLAVVEDACHALGGTEAGGAPVGACHWSEMAAFSFHPVKTITSGEGGMVTTNRDDWAERLARLRTHGMVRDPERLTRRSLAFDADSGVPNPWYYEMPDIGFNYRLSDIHAALGRSQLAKLDEFVAHRRRLVLRYDRVLAPLAPAVRPIARTGVGEPAWHLYVVSCDFAAIGKSRARVMAELRERGIGTQVHYLPVAHQPYYIARYGPQTMPGADRYYARALSLPLFSGMTGNDVDRVAGALAAVVGAGH